MIKAINKYLDEGVAKLDLIILIIGTASLKLKRRFPDDRQARTLAIMDEARAELSIEDNPKLRKSLNGIESYKEKYGLPITQ